MLSYTIIKITTIHNLFKLKKKETARLLAIVAVIPTVTFKLAMFTLIESLGLFSGTKLYVPVLPQIVVLVIDNLPM